MKPDQHHHGDPYSQKLMHSLVLSVSISCARVVSASEATLEDPNIGAAIQDGIAKLVQLDELAMAASQHMLSNTPPRHIIEDEPFAEMADALRSLESVLASKIELYSNLPSIRAEFSSLRRSIAVARSRIAQNSMLLKQMVNVPKSYESSIDVKGLEALASFSTERLHQQVS